MTGWLWLAIVGAFVIGSMQAMVNGPVQAILQASIEPEMQGRIFTLVGSLAAGMSPLGLIIAGPVADAFGVQSWYIVGGLVTILIGVVGFFLPAVLYVEEGRPVLLRAAADLGEGLVEDGEAAVPEPVTPHV